MESILERLKDSLLDTQGAKVRAGIEISIRCPFCGDSLNEDHSHFYIGFDIQEEKTSLPYHCKKCGSSGGNINYELFQRVTNKNDEEIRIFLNKLNKNMSLLKKSISIDDIVIPQWDLQYKPLIRSDYEKIESFKKRTGIETFNSKTIKNYKIILNLRNFLKMNNIKPSEIDERYKYMMNDLSENYIGFLTYYNNYIYLRHKLYKPPAGKPKHCRLQLKSYKGKFIYIPSNFQFNMMAEKPKLALTEGVYDLINVQNRFYSKEQGDIMYAASGSKGSFNTVFNNVVRITGAADLEVTLYADADVNVKEAKRLIFGKVTDSYKAKIIYHKDLKDFGNAEEGYNGIIKYEV